MLSSPDGALESIGSAHVEIPIPENSGNIEITIALFNPDSEVPTVYTLIILRLAPDDLVSGIGWNKLKANDHGYEYRFVTKGMTVGALKSEFGQFLPDVSVRVQNRDGAPLQDHEQAASGARVYLTRDDNRPPHTGGRFFHGRQSKIIFNQPRLTKFLLLSGLIPGAKLC